MSPGVPDSSGTMYSRSNSEKRVSWRESGDGDLPVFAEDEPGRAGMTCGVVGIVRSASFRRRSKKEPHWITSEYHRRVVRTFPASPKELCLI